MTPATLSASASSSTFPSISSLAACTWCGTFEIAPNKEEEGFKFLREKGMVINPFDKAPAIQRVKGYWQEYAEKVKATDILAKMVS